LFLLLHHRRRGLRRRRLLSALQPGEQKILADAVADFHQDLLDRAGRRRRDLHRRLVGFKGDQRIVQLDDVARLHGDFDDRYVLEVPMSELSHR
jgi:hypothetical protein